MRATICIRGTDAGYIVKCQVGGYIETVYEGDSIDLASEVASKIRWRMLQEGWVDVTVKIDNVRERVTIAIPDPDEEDEFVSPVGHGMHTPLIGMPDRLRRHHKDILQRCFEELKSRNIDLGGEEHVDEMIEYMLDHLVGDAGPGYIVTECLQRARLEEPQFYRPEGMA